MHPIPLSEKFDTYNNVLRRDLHQRRSHLLRQLAATIAITAVTAGCGGIPTNIVGKAFFIWIPSAQASVAIGSFKYGKEEEIG